jgi:hypothetical protein
MTTVPQLNNDCSNAESTVPDHRGECSRPVRQHKPLRGRAQRYLLITDMREVCGVRLVDHVDIDSARITRTLSGVANKFRTRERCSSGNVTP